MSKQSWNIDIQQVDNGFLLKVCDRKKYESTETVYRTADEMCDAFRQVVNHIQGGYLMLSPPASSTESED